MKKLYKISPLIIDVGFQPFSNKWTFPKKFTDLSQDGPLYILRGCRSKYPKNIVFLSLQIDFVFK